MRIVDRYITKSIIGILLATIVMFCCLYILIDIASNLDDLIDRKVPAFILLRYYMSLLPTMLVQTLPIACLISALFTYSHLNNSNEIIALRTSGLNFWKLARPAICVALVVSAFIFWLNEKYVPETQVKSEMIRNENMINRADSRKRTKGKIKNLTFYGLKNRLYFIDEFDPNTSELSGITIIGFDSKQNVKEKIVAWKGEWTGIIWKFKDCQVTFFDTEKFTDQIKVKVYANRLMDIKETPDDFVRQRLNVSAMNIRQLRDYISRFENSGATKAITNLRVDLHQKWAYPFGTIVIVLAGLPIAMMTGRRKAVTFASLGIATAIGFLYYVCNAVCLALGKGDAVPPILSAWLAPIIFASIAFYLIKTKFE